MIWCFYIVYVAGQAGVSFIFSTLYKVSVHKGNFQDRKPHGFFPYIHWLDKIKDGPRDYKTFFILNSTEHEISTAHKN